MDELSAILARHCQENAIIPCIVPGLTLARAGKVMPPYTAVYSPALCVMAQGRKRVVMGKSVFIYDPKTYLIASADVPVTCDIYEAPYAGFSVALNPAQIAEVLMTMPGNSAAPSGSAPSRAGSSAAASPALAVHQLEGALFDTVMRLLRLLDQPHHIPVLAPLIQREILYHLLLGAQGEMMRQLAVPASQLSRISRAIAFIRSRFDKLIRICDLAQEAGMSAPSFHRHFRAVTAMSPLQFQKRLRLQEARRMLLSQDADAATVGFTVGYESPSQFSREYRRLFGAPPGRDTADMRRTLVA